MSEQNESGYLVRDEPLKTHWLETALTDAEQVTAEALRNAMDEAANRLAQQYGPKWSYKRTAHPLSNPGPGNPIRGNKWVRADRGNEPEAAYKPSVTLPTPESLREFVKRCVDEHLDELAREFSEHPGLQPGTWRAEKASE